MAAEVNPYESPEAAALRAPQKFPWETVLYLFGGLLIATALFATLFWTIWAREMPDYFPVTALLAWVIGSWAIVHGMRLVVRIGATVLICALGHGFTIALIVLFIPPPPGGVNLFRGWEGAVEGFLIFGIVGGAIGLVLTAAKELVWHVGLWLLRKVRGA